MDCFIKYIIKNRTINILIKFIFNKFSDEWIWNKIKNFTVDGEHDFAIDKGSSINDSHRFEAITKASDRAVTEILSKMAVASFK